MSISPYLCIRRTARMLHVTALGKLWCDNIQAIACFGGLCLLVLVDLHARLFEEPRQAFLPLLQIKLVQESASITKWSSAFRVQHVNQKFDILLQGPPSHTTAGRLHSMLEDSERFSTTTPDIFGPVLPQWQPNPSGRSTESAAREMPWQLSAVPEGHEAVHIAPASDTHTRAAKAVSPEQHCLTAVGSSKLLASNQVATLMVDSPVGNVQTIPAAASGASGTLAADLPHPSQRSGPEGDHSRAAC